MQIPENIWPGTYAPTLVRTGRGLTIGGTRITLYQIMDFLKAGYPPEEIRDDFGLTIRQMREVTEYIETHRDEAENEYPTSLPVLTVSKAGTDETKNLS